jgi:hypothetical protein
MGNKTSLVVVTWDGKSKPLNHILVDAIPEFDILVFDHSAKCTSVEVKGLPNLKLLSKATENKGQIFDELYKYLYVQHSSNYNYIGVFDDDLYSSISDINKLLFIGDLEALDVFQPSITQDSYHDHQKFIHKPGFQTIEDSWVEIMCPFYKEELFKAASPYYKYTISGQGIDIYLMPCLQQILNLKKTAVVHGVQIKHCRPIQSGNRIYSNGKTNLEEIEVIRLKSIELVQQTKPGIFDTSFIKEVLEVDHLNRRSLKQKMKRVQLLLKNCYQLLLNESYR